MKKNDTSGFKMTPKGFWVVWTDTPTGILPRREVQDAFKVLMTHWILQFALRIAFRCVLHRCGNQDIRRWKCLLTLCFWLCLLIINDLNQPEARLNKRLFFLWLAYDFWSWDLKNKRKYHREIIFEDDLTCEGFGAFLRHVASPLNIPKNR